MWSFTHSLDICLACVASTVAYERIELLQVLHEGDKQRRMENCEFLLQTMAEDCVTPSEIVQRERETLQKLMCFVRLHGERCVVSFPDAENTLTSRRT